MSKSEFVDGQTHEPLPGQGSFPFLDKDGVEKRAAIDIDEAAMLFRLYLQAFLNGDKQDQDELWSALLTAGLDVTLHTVEPGLFSTPGDVAEYRLNYGLDDEDGDES